MQNSQADVPTEDRLELSAADWVHIGFILTKLTRNQRKLLQGYEGTMYATPVTPLMSPSNLPSVALEKLRAVTPEEALSLTGIEIFRKCLHS